MKILVRRNQMKMKGDISVKSLMRNINSGFQMLSHIDWVSAYGSRLSVASVLGAVGLFLAVRDGRLGSFNKLLLPRDDSSEKLCYVPGLQNIGNNCFLNVVLQSLASCSSFNRFLDEVKELVLDDGDLPVLVSLVALLEELRTLRNQSKVLNPQKVMSAMQEYIPQFQLTNQQDAAEALLHLLSSLREELSESYMSNHGSLEDVDVPTSRVIAWRKINNMNEPQKWRQQYIGPFDGILGSFLTCRTCSSEIMMDFGFFHTLSLPLMFNSGASILGKFTIEECIKKFLSPEHVEYYSCSRCWHIGALKYLSSLEGHQEEIRKLSCCDEQDICDCRKWSSLQGLPWSNRFSYTFKQLSIAHCPQILCIHLQRTSMNGFGELLKIQGHVSFPLILDLSPYLKHEVGIQKQILNKHMTSREQQYPPIIPHPGVIDIHSDRMKIKDDTSHSELDSLHTETDKMAPCDPITQKKHLYRLVSVVEHFGKAGGGHYTVYRGAINQNKENDDDGGIDTPLQWFRISDSEVHQASEEDALGADASLLFYERI